MPSTVIWLTTVGTPYNNKVALFLFKTKIILTVWTWMILLRLPLDVPANRGIKKQAYT